MPFEGCKHLDVELFDLTSARAVAAARSPTRLGRIQLTLVFQTLSHFSQLEKHQARIETLIVILSWRNYLDLSDRFSLT